MSKNKQRQKVLAQDVALARFSVISPLLCRKMTAEEYSDEIARVSAAVHRFPEGFKQVSKRNVRRWCAYYKNGRPPTGEAGFEALLPATRSDLGQTRTLAPELIDCAVALREEAPNRKTSRIITLLESLARDRGEPLPQISESTLNYHLRARGATRHKLRSKSRAFRRYEHSHRNSCWQGDWSNGIWLPHPTQPGKMRQCFLHGFIDDRTRYIPHAEFYFRQNLPCLEDCLRKAVLKGGVPEMTYVDNGPCYQARQFKLLTGRLGIHLVHATEFCPEGKGKIERWIQTVQEDFFQEAERSEATTLAALNVFFWSWLDKVYHSRTHSTTGQSPRERWESEKSDIRYVPPEKLIDIFLWEEERTVDKSGTFGLDGNRYPVPEQLVREKIQVRFDPFDLEKVRVYHNGVFVEVVSPEKLNSHTYCKAMPRRHDKAAPLESSKAFRRQLSSDYKERVEETMAGLPRNSGDGNLTESSFYELLKSALSRRELGTHEKNIAFDFFQKHCPISKELADSTLLAMVAEKGNRLHLRHYLRRLQEAKAGAKGGE